MKVEKKIKGRLQLTKCQKRLLRKSIRNLLGPGLIEAPEEKIEAREAALFVRLALNAGSFH